MISAAFSTWFYKTFWGEIYKQTFSPYSNIYELGREPATRNDSFELNRLLCRIVNWCTKSFIRLSTYWVTVAAIPSNQFQQKNNILVLKKFRTVDEMSVDEMALDKMTFCANCNIWNTALNIFAIHANIIIILLHKFFIILVIWHRSWPMY